MSNWAEALPEGKAKGFAFVLSFGSWCAQVVQIAQTPDGIKRGFSVFEAKSRRVSSIDGSGQGTAVSGDAVWSGVLAGNQGDEALYLNRAETAIKEREAALEIDNGEAQVVKHGPIHITTHQAIEASQPQGVRRSYATEFSALRPSYAERSKPRYRVP